MGGQPLFKVGEEVILQAINLSEYNGEYIVEDIIFDKQALTIDGSKYSGFSYKLEGNSTWWVEYVLKKKSPPSEFTFDELMSKLKVDKPVEIDYYRLQINL